MIVTYELKHNPKPRRPLTPEEIAAIEAKAPRDEDIVYDEARRAPARTESLADPFSSALHRALFFCLKQRQTRCSFAILSVRSWQTPGALQGGKGKNGRLFRSSARGTRPVLPRLLFSPRCDI